MAGVKIDDQIRKLIKAAEDANWSITVTRNSRLKWTDAEGNQVAISPMRCTGGRTLPNLKAQLRNAGLALPEDDQRAKREVVVTEAVEVDLPVEEVTPMQAVEVLMDYVSAQESRDWEEANADFARMNAELERLKAQIEDNRSTIATLTTQVQRKDRLLEEIRKCFEMQSWQVLPAIARLVGIDA